MNLQKQSSNSGQLIWGLALILMGLAVFFRVPVVVPKLEEMGQSDVTIGFFRVCIYLVGIILVGGGLKKVMRHFKPVEKGDGRPPDDSNDV